MVGTLTVTARVKGAIPVWRTVPGRRKGNDRRWRPFVLRMGVWWATLDSNQ